MQNGTYHHGLLQFVRLEQVSDVAEWWTIRGIPNVANAPGPTGLGEDAHLGRQFRRHDE